MIKPCGVLRDQKLFIRNPKNKRPNEVDLVFSQARYKMEQVRCKSVSVGKNDC